MYLACLAPVAALFTQEEEDNEGALKREGVVKMVGGMMDHWDGNHGMPLG
jgi:hypothetical protein